MKQKLAAFFHTCAALPKLCYLVAAVLWLAWGAWCRIDDIGLEAWSEVPVTGFTLVDLAPAPDVPYGYTTTSADPQMILEGLAGRKLRTVSYVPLSLSEDPREVCLYYTTRPDEPFSRDKRVFPRVEGNGRYVFTLPHGDVASLRIDPCSPEAERSMTLAFTHGVVDLDYPSTLPPGWRYFVPSWYQLFCLLLYPALAAAALDWLRAACRTLKKG